MELAIPAWLLLLLALPLLQLPWRRTARGIPLPVAGAISRRAGFVAALPSAFRLAALACLVLALARPRTAGGVVESPTEGVPIVVALDVSSSMLAQDWRCAAPPCAPGDPPRDRLDVAKETIGRFIAARPSDPVGLVAFAAEAITLVPLTTHQPLLRSALESVRVGLLEDGTAIGEGLATAVNRLRRAPGRTRVVVLMSDGESNRGTIDPLTAAAAAAQFGIQVHTVGVFAPGGTGQDVDERTLSEIARLTGGEYHRATDPSSLRRIYDRIDRLVRVPIERRAVVVYREWYLWLLAAAAVALLAEWAIRASRWGVIP